MRTARRSVRFPDSGPNRLSQFEGRSLNSPLVGTGPDADRPNRTAESPKLFRGQMYATLSVSRMSVKFLSALGATPKLAMEVDNCALQDIYHLPPVATSAKPNTRFRRRGAGNGSSHRGNRGRPPVRPPAGFLSRASSYILWQSIPKSGKIAADREHRVRSDGPEGGSRYGS